MLNTVLSDIQDTANSNVSFSEFYMNYVMKIQDMDITNEILPLIKKESTEYVTMEKRLQRIRRKNMRKMSVDFQQ